MATRFDKLKEDNNSIVSGYEGNTHPEDYIVQVVVDVCKLYEDEATECVKEASYKGHSTLTKGTFNELRPLRNRMRDRQVWTEIL